MTFPKPPKNAVSATISATGSWKPTATSHRKSNTASSAGSNSAGTAPTSPIGHPTDVRGRPAVHPTPHTPSAPFLPSRAHTVADMDHGHPVSTWWIGASVPVADAADHADVLHSGSAIRPRPAPDP